MAGICRANISHLWREFTWPRCRLHSRSQALVRDTVAYFPAKDYNATYREEGFNELWAGSWDRRASGRVFSFVLQITHTSSQREGWKKRQSRKRHPALVTAEEIVSKQNVFQSFS